MSILPLFDRADDADLAGASGRTWSVSELTALVKAPRRSASGEAAPALALLRAADGPKDVLAHERPEAAAVQAALDCGQFTFGENRVQEAHDKFAGLRAANPQLRLHLIGALQTNKAADAVRIADTIETLDRPRLADALALAAERAELGQSAL